MASRPQKLSVPIGAPRHVAEVVNQMNRVLKELQAQIDNNALDVQKANANLGTVNSRLENLTPAALVALINATVSE